MSKTSQANISTQYSGDGWPNGQPWTSGAILNNPSPATVGTFALAPTATVTLAVPAGSLWVRLSPPSSGVLSKLWKTVIGDTGVYLSPVSPSFLTFDPAHLPTDLYVTAGAGTLTESIDYEFG